MTDQERDDVPMLLRNVELPRFPLRSTSMCIPVRDDEYEEDTFVPHTGPLFIQPPTQTTSGIPFTSRDTPDRLPRPSQGKPVSKPHAIMPEETGGNRWSYSGQVPKNEHLLMSGPLGQCNNPDCVNCPPACKNKRHFHRGSNALDNKLHNTISGHVGGWKKKIEKILSNIPIMNPHAKVVQQWNQFFVISCLIAIFIDPLFFFLLSVEQVILTSFQ